MLSAGRKWGETGPLPIETKEVEALLNMAGFRDPQTKMKYLRLMRGMDRVELKYHIEKAKAKR